MHTILTDMVFYKNSKVVATTLLLCLGGYLFSPQERVGQIAGLAFVALMGQRFYFAWYKHQQRQIYTKVDRYLQAHDLMDDIAVLLKPNGECVLYGHANTVMQPWDRVEHLYTHHQRLHALQIFQTFDWSLLRHGLARCYPKTSARFLVCYSPLLKRTCCFRIGRHMPNPDALHPYAPAMAFPIEGDTQRSV